MLATAVSKLHGSAVLATGSGGSLTAAYLVAQLQEVFSRGVGKAVTPMELISSQVPLSRAGVVFISAGGRNIDINRALRETLKREPGRALVICADQESPLVNVAKSTDHADAIAFRLPTGRDGFLATNSLLAFIVLICRAWCNAAGMSVNLPAELQEAYPDPDFTAFDGALAGVWSKETICVLHGDRTKVAAVDLESKFTEAALGSVQISDYRNFAHGRHHWLAKHAENSGIIAFITDSDEAIARKTLDLVPPEVPTVQFRIDEDRELGIVKSLLHVYHLTASIGRARRIDPGQPGVPAFGRKMYHLRANPMKSESKIGITDTKRIAIERKSGQKVDELARAGTLEFWSRAYEGYRKVFNGVKFSSVIFDYDGTLCGTSSRYSGIDDQVVERISTLLENSIYVGVATGRGRSVADDLRSKISSKFHHKIIIGYYNGGIVSDLATDAFKQSSRKHDGPLHELTQCFESGDEFSAVFSWEPREMQITVHPNLGYSTDDVLRLIRQTIEIEQIAGLSVLYSSHSVDVLAPGISKLNLVNHLHSSLPSGTEVMCIGDRGKYPGNDFLLLSGRFTLSVDECSFDPYSCWNLAPPGVRGVQSALQYIDAFEIQKGTFMFNPTVLGKARK